MLEYLCLSHHGVKGMKWGIRHYQNKDGSLTEAGKKHYRITNYNAGGVIPKGTKLYRVSTQRDDPTFDNKKYVSTSQYDNWKWKKYIGDALKKQGQNVYVHTYTTMEDIKVASETELGKKFMDYYKRNPHMVMDSLIRTREIFPEMAKTEYSTAAKAASISMAAQTDLGKSIVTSLLGDGYGAVTDAHGRNTSYDPVILLDPNKKISRTKTERY